MRGRCWSGKRSSSVNLGERRFGTLSLVSEGDVVGSYAAPRKLAWCDLTKPPVATEDFVKSRCTLRHGRFRTALIRAAKSLLPDYSGVGSPNALQKSFTASRLDSEAGAGEMPSACKSFKMSAEVRPLPVTCVRAALFSSRTRCA